MRAVAESLGLYIEKLEAKMLATPIPDDPLSEAGQQYDTLMAWYNKHIADARAKLLAIRQ